MMMMMMMKMMMEDWEFQLHCLESVLGRLNLALGGVARDGIGMIPWLCDDLSSEPVKQRRDCIEVSTAALQGFAFILHSCISSPATSYTWRTSLLGEQLRDK